MFIQLYDGKWKYPVIRITRKDFMLFKKELIDYRNSLGFGELFEFEEFSKRLFAEKKIKGGVVKTKIIPLDIIDYGK